MPDDTPKPLSLRDMAAQIKPGDRWPFEPPAPDLGPDGGLRAPLGPHPPPSLADTAEEPDSSRDR